MKFRILLKRYIGQLSLIGMLLLSISAVINLNQLREEITTPEQDNDEISNILSKFPEVSKDGSSGVTPTKIRASFPFTGFVENAGQQKNSEILYYFSTGSSGIAFQESKILITQVVESDTSHKDLSLNNRFKTKPEKMRLLPAKEPDFLSFEITFQNSNNVQPSGVDKMSHTTNYFVDTMHFTDLASFKEIWYYNIYDHIDLRYYMSEKGLKYECYIYPGGNPSDIQLQFSSNVLIKNTPTEVKIWSSTEYRQNHQSELLLTDSNLIAYTGDHLATSNTNSDLYSNENLVEVFFSSKDSQSSVVGFDIAHYDTSKLLIIDPLYLGFSTFIGGSGEEYNNKIAVDSDDNMYITGYTRSNDFPTFNAYNSTYSGNSDAFVAKLNATGNGLVFSTYLGGTLRDGGSDIAVDPSGNSYISGFTESNNFPTYKAYNSTFSGTSDAFVTKLNATGNGLIFSTYLGGTQSDAGLGIAVDPSGTSYISGYTYSSDFPTLHAYNSSFSGSIDVFVTKLNATGNGLVFSTYLGGTQSDAGYGIAVDPVGNSYITGFTQNSNFPTFNAYNSTYGGYSDIFVTKLNATGNGLVFSTFLGGTQSDEGYGIAIDPMGNSYITGITESSNFPTYNAYNSTYGGYSDIFVTKLNATGNGLVFSTFLGGSSEDLGFGIAIDPMGNSYITGVTGSEDLPTYNAYNSTYSGGYDAFVSKLNATGNGLVFSTFLGGTEEDDGWGIAVDLSGNSYITGNTDSEDFPTYNSFNQTQSGDYDVFVTKLIADDDPPKIFIQNPINQYYKTSTLDFIYTITDLRLDTVVIYIDSVANSSSILSGSPLVGLGEGPHNITIVANDTFGFQSRKVILFIIDTTKPVITLSSPLAKTYDTDSITVSYTIAETHPYTTLLYLDGVVNTTNWQSGHSLTQMANGNHNLTIVVTDSAGNVKIQQVSFTILVPEQTTTSQSKSTSASTSPSTSTTSSKARGSPGFTGVTVLLSSLVLVPVLYYRKKGKF